MRRSVILKKEYYTGTVYEWNLPAGRTCPFAGVCKPRSDTDGFKCYAISAERFPGVRISRKANLKYILDGGIPEIPAECKSLPMWLKRKEEIPSNLTLTASFGGLSDHLIRSNGLKSALVVNSKLEALIRRLRIDTNDDLARVPDLSFALLNNRKSKPQAPERERERERAWTRQWIKDCEK